jgi:hypothetical protein
MQQDEIDTLSEVTGHKVFRCSGVKLGPGGAHTKNLKLCWSERKKKRERERERSVRETKI